jgi:amidase
MKAVIDQSPWKLDPVAIRKKWDAAEYALADHGHGSGPLCFGFLWNDGLVKPHPPVARALELTKKALEEAGHIGD